MGAQMSGMWDGVNKDVAALMSACHLPQAGQAQPGAAFGSPVATRSGGAPKSVRCAMGGLPRTQQAACSADASAPAGRACSQPLPSSPVVNQLRAALNEATCAVAAAKACGKVRQATAPGYA